MTDVRLHDPLAFAGRVEMLTVESAVLRKNPLGDPHVRELPVYVPPGHGDRQLPLIFVLAGFTGRGQSYLETHPWKRGIVAAWDKEVSAGRVPPALLALPDCFTRLGGSQNVDSPAVGAYATHVTRELAPLVAERYGVLGRPGVVGKSSGGFGALHLVMEHPGVFAACGSISGDCGFEALFGGEFLAALRGLVPFGMDPRRFLARFEERHELGGDNHALINVLAMAACYSPRGGSELGFELPFDLATGERRDDVWQRWLAFDPLERVAARVETLRALALLHVECGLLDEFHIQWGTRRLAARLARLGIPHVHQEHPGGHRGIDDRYPPLLAALASALASGAA